MITYLGLIQQGLFFALITALIVAMASRLLYPLFEFKLKNLNPSTQSTLILLWSVLPIFSAFGIVFLALLPSILQIAGLSSDHCLGHIDGHVHFCLIHRSAPVESWLVWAPGLFFIAILSIIILNMFVECWETLRFKNSLDQYAPCDSNQGLVTLDTQTPLALTCGLLKQKIFISKGLVDKLTTEEQEMIVAHEKAHLMRRDAIKKLIARSFSLAHFPAVRLMLLSHLNLACEQACDIASSKVSEDPGKVAALLLKVERIYKRHLFIASPLTSGVLDYSGSSLPERISCLLEQKNYQSLNKVALLVVLTASLVILFSHDMVHDALEHLMFLIAGH